MSVGEGLPHDQAILLGGGDIDRIQGITDGVGMFIDPVDPSGCIIGCAATGYCPNRRYTGLPSRRESHLVV